MKRNNSFKPKSTQEKNEKKLSEIQLNPPVVTQLNLPPAPTHLATKNSELKNDPMYIESFIVDGEKGVIPQKPVAEYCPSTDSFLPLVQADYELLSSTARGFSKVVSLSTYTYYNIQLLWHRLLTIENHRGNLNFRESNYLDSFGGGDTYGATSTVLNYLKSLGDFCDGTGTHHHLRVRHPNNTGDFGRISVDTHNYYEALPSPRFAATRILKDLEFTKGTLRTSDWDIPELRPEEQRHDSTQASSSSVRRRPHTRSQSRTRDPMAEAFAEVGLEQEFEQEEAIQQPENVGAEIEGNRPTVNLLGWQYAMKLNKNQENWLTPILNEHNRFTYEFPQFCFSAALMQLVSNQLNAVTSYNILPCTVPSRSGSSATQSFIDIDELPCASRTKYYCDGLADVRSLCLLDSRLITGQRVFGLRIRKNTLDETNPWACYYFDNYTEVPPDWVRNRNQVFNNGLLILNLADKSSVIADRDPFRLAYLRGAIKKAR